MVNASGPPWHGRHFLIVQPVHVCGCVHCVGGWEQNVRQGCVSYATFAGMALNSTIK